MPDILAQKIASYKPAAETVEIIRRAPIVLLVGISGAGKDTTRRALVQQKAYHSIVSHTTRRPRENHGVLEQDDVEYHFISLDQAKQMLDQQAFVEAKYYGGNIYGTSVAEIQKAYASKMTAVADIEVQGVAEYVNLSSNITPIFLLPPSYEVWQDRLQQRYLGGVLDAADLHKRTETAMVELEHALEADHFHFVVNDQMDSTVQTVDELVHGSVSRAEETETRAVAQKLLEDIKKSL